MSTVSAPAFYPVTFRTWEEADAFAESLRAAGHVTACELRPAGWVVYVTEPWGLAADRERSRARRAAA